MSLFLDTNAVIYLVEQPPVWGVKVAARIASFRARGETLAVSHLVRMECSVGPLRANDQMRLADFDTFFAGPDLKVLPITAAVCDRVARIRAQYSFRPLDCLHLAAVEHGCTQFLTNDVLLQRFPDVVVEFVA